MTTKTNISLTFNFDHFEDASSTIEYIENSVSALLTQECNVRVLSQEVVINSVDTLPPPYTSLRDLYSNPNSDPQPEYVSLRSLHQASSSQVDTYSRYTS